ncbi:hypothetical protein KNE206_36750 [Kitasatospora sp. NE20-6]|uniref:hypothetical protein n=1 Tax=Kitasatospora sp. NE20-6 TaxID=2859066 RepID=UPI0034DC8FEA
MHQDPRATPPYGSAVPGPGVRRLLGTAAPAAGGCAVCDGPLDPRRDDPVPGVLVDGPTGAQHRALHTHPACAPSRVWAPTQLDAARVGAGRAPVGGPVTPDDRPRAEDALVPAMSGGPGHVRPAAVHHPGGPYPHGLLGHLADRLTEGLPPLDITGAVPAEDLPGWTVHVASGRIHAVTYDHGAAFWWARPGGVATSREWRRAAHTTGVVWFVVLPGGEDTIAPGDTAALGRAVRDGLVLGGIARLSGTVY